MDNKYNKKDLLHSAIAGGSVSLIVTLLVLNASGINLPDSPTLSAAVVNNAQAQTIDNMQGMPDMEKKIISTVAKANPAVVSIIIKEDVPVYEQYMYERDFGNGTIRIPGLKEKGTKKEEVGGGSGFLVSPDGYIITNKHVVSSEDAEYTVFTNDGKDFKAKVIAKDPLNDIALIKIDENNLPYLAFGNSDQLMVGQSVIAIGNPLMEFSNSVSVGVVSGLSRSIIAGSPMGQSEQIEDVIQTDAAINPGNSGGPLLDLNGNVIGVNVAVASAENIGFALPANSVKNVIDSIKQNGRIVRPYLGVRYVPINSKIQESENLPVDYGALVTHGETSEDAAVMPNSPADKAGIREGVIILEMDGQKINDTSLAKIIAKHQIGDSVSVKLLRDGKEQTLNLTLEEMKSI